VTPERFAALWRSLLPVGLVDRDGSGYLRKSWTPTDLAAREWFTEEALDRDLDVETDGNGNLWAWWEPVAASGKAVVTGSHLDSVPHGGAYDGALGVVSALLAVDLLRERGFSPTRPVGIVVFTEEEGARFGVPCLGSRLLTGALDPVAARQLTDDRGAALGEAMIKAGLDPALMGPDPDRLARIGTFVELHVEQGRALADLDAPVGVASAIWPHGRWRLDVTGEGNHAGTTRMDDRHDPMLTAAFAVLAANKEARLHGAHATVGRITPVPNATNAVPARVSAWLDARAPDASVLASLVEAVDRRVAERAARDGTGYRLVEESRSSTVDFDGSLRDRLASLLKAPVLPTGAGHDAGILAAHVSTAMLFVRNPTGVSHAPGEYASDDDCARGVAALADVLDELTRP
jgi:N-carbamoyl-L-amino-acid hydrolase